jgi:hypothetical protein
MLGAANLIIARKPDAKEIIAKFAPYEGWTGVLGAFYGVFMLLSALGAMSMLGAGLISMLYWIVYVAAASLQILLGLILGVGTAKTFIKQPQAIEKLTQASQKLAPFKGTLGFAAMGTSIAFLVLYFLL